MKTLPMFLSTGLLCAGLAVGCAESNTPEPGADADAAAGNAADGNTADVTQAAWVDDTSVTKAHVQVTGMT